MRCLRTFLYTLALAGGLVMAGGVAGLSLHALAGAREQHAFKHFSAARANSAELGKATAALGRRLSLTGKLVRPSAPPKRTTDDYQYDDGTSENVIGLTAGGEICWMHQFNTIAGLETIVAVSTAWGSPAFPGLAPPNGTAARVYVWDDLNNDGDPSDAVLLAQQNVVVANVDTDILNKYLLTPPVVVSGSFFIGASVVHASGQFPAPQDTTTPYTNEAWAAGDSSGVFDPVNLLANDDPPVEMSTIGWPGYWLLRANAVGAGVIVFDQKGAFEDYCQTHGKLLKGVVEDFEPPVSNVPPGGLVGPLADPLVGNVPNVDPNGVGFPNGLANKNLAMASNMFEANPPPGPLGAQFGGGLVAAAATTPFNVKVGAMSFAESTDLYFDPAENHTGVGFTLEDPAQSIAHITVFNKSDQVIYKDVINAPAGAKTFFGIWSPETIGRINIGGPGGELVDDIQMWMEVPPKCADLDGDGDVDLDDFAIFAACYNGSARPPATTCPPGAGADLDNDGDVDLDDFAIFAGCYNGSARPPAATCSLGC